MDQDILAKMAAENKGLREQIAWMEAGSQPKPVPTFHISLLHMYSQDQWHDNAYIVGNRYGLEELKKAVEQALKDDCGSPKIGTANVMVSDGEGFDTVVIRCDKDWQDDVWQNLFLPYVGKSAEDKNPKGIPPEEFFMNMIKGDSNGQKKA